MIERIEFKVNGKSMQLAVDGSRSLLWVLRTDLGLTGVKYGCGEGLCGACTVLVDMEPVRSCQMSIKDVRGNEVTTIEGLAEGGELHPLQKAFMEHDALQCGYCTPGMILNAHALLREKPHPSIAAIVEGMEDNLCRCGAHNRIVRAILAASREKKG